MNGIIDLANLILDKIKPETLSQYYSNQITLFEGLSDIEKANKSLSVFLLGEKILLKEKTSNIERLTFRNEILLGFTDLIKTPIFQIALSSTDKQEKALSKLFLETLLTNQSISVDFFNNNMNKISVLFSTEINQKQLTSFSNELYKQLSGEVTKEVAINYFHKTYHELNEVYELLEGFESVIQLLPNSESIVEKLTSLGSFKSQQFLIDNIKSLEEKNQKLSLELAGKLKSENTLKESESLLNKIIESAIDSMVLLGENGEINYWSDQSENLFGWKKSEIILQEFSQSLIPQDLRESFNQELTYFLDSSIQISNKKKRFETKLIHKNKSLTEVEISMTSIKINESTIVSAFIRNIDQRKNYEREILESRDKAEEASAAKLTFLSMMSHEIRTPLNAVIGTSQLLLEEDPRKDQLENLNILKFSAENLLSIINDILDFNKAEAGKMILEKTSFNLDELCQNIVNSFIPQSREKGIVIKYENKLKRINLVTGDETRLSQVLINLFGNAMKFTSEGSVRLEVELINLYERIGEVKFEVIDTGIGIEKEKINTIFDRFTQVHEPNPQKNYGGTGLGLPIAKKLVNLMGSELSVISNPGLGSNFYFSIKLPIPFKESSSGKTSKNDEFLNISNKKILIVEDHKINQIVASKFLKKFKCEISISENGLEALKLIQNNEHFDLILMDLEMPIMNGYETAIAIRDLEKTTNFSTPIVALSANALMDVSKKVMEAGMNGYISKPFEAKHFYAQISDNIK